MRLDFNELSAAEAEALALLAEECAETIHVIGKILRHGLHSKAPTRPCDPTNHEMLIHELGDIRAAQLLCAKYMSLDSVVIQEATEEKLKELHKFLHHATTEGLI